MNATRETPEMSATPHPPTWKRPFTCRGAVVVWNSGGLTNHFWKTGIDFRFVRLTKYIVHWALAETTRLEFLFCHCPFFFVSQIDDGLWSCIELSRDKWRIDSLCFLAKNVGSGIICRPTRPFSAGRSLFAS